MHRILKPAVYESPSDDFLREGHMKVSEIAQQLNLTPEEIFWRLRQGNSHALSDFSRDGSRNTPIYPPNCKSPMPREFANGYIPEYAWDQIIKNR